MKFTFEVQIGPADRNITRDQLPILPLLLSLLLLTPCYGYLELTRHNNEPSEDDGRPQGVGEDLSRREYIVNDEIDNKRQRRDTYRGNAGSGSQGTNCTLILNGTDNSTDFNHSLGIYFTGCKCCEYDSDCCVNGSGSGYNNMRYDCSEGEVCCLGNKYFILTNRNLTYNDDRLNTSHCINASDIWCAEIVSASQDSSEMTTGYVISSSTPGPAMSVTCYSTNIVTSSPEPTPSLSDSMITLQESSEMILEPTISLSTKGSAIHQICYCDSANIVTSSTELSSGYGSTPLSTTINTVPTATTSDSEFYSDTIETSRMTQGVDQTIELTAVTTQARTIAIQPSPQSTTASVPAGVSTLSNTTVLTTESVSSKVTGMTAAETSTVLQTPTMTPNLTTVETSRNMTAVTTQATTISIQPSPQSTTAPVPTGVSMLSSAMILITDSVSSKATGMTVAETSTVLQTPTMTPNFTTTDDLVVQLGIGLGIAAVVVVVVCVIVVFVLIYIW